MFANGCKGYSDLFLSCDKQDNNVERALSPSDTTILKSMVDYWVVMNPNSLISSLQPLQPLQPLQLQNDSGSSNKEKKDLLLLEAMSETSPAFMQSQQYLPDSIGDHIFDSAAAEQEEEEGGLLGFEGAAGLPLNADDFSEFLRATPLASPSPGPGTEPGPDTRTNTGLGGATLFR